MPELRVGRPEAAHVVWMGKVMPADSAPTAKGARVRGVVQGMVGAAVATALFFFVSPVLGKVVVSIAGVIAASALVSPLGLYAGIERLFAALGRWIGLALTWTLLPAIFYFFFVPFGLLFRRGRRDSMKRFFDREATSYWTLRAAQPVAQTPAEAARRYRP